MRPTPVSASSGPGVRAGEAGPKAGEGQRGSVAVRVVGAAEEAAQETGRHTDHGTSRDEDGAPHDGHSPEPAHATTAMPERGHHPEETAATPVTGVPTADRPATQPARAATQPDGARSLPFERHTLAPIVQGVLVRHAALRVGAAGASFRVVLQPKALGEVVVQVQRDMLGLHVNLTPQRAETHQMLDQHLPELIAQLRAGDTGPVQASVHMSSQGPTSSGGGNGGQAFTGQQNAFGFAGQPGSGQGGRQHEAERPQDTLPGTPVRIEPRTATAGGQRARVAAWQTAGSARIDLQA